MRKRVNNRDRNREMSSRQLTNGVDSRRLLAVSINDDHFCIDERAILDEESRTESNDFDVVDELDLAKEPMIDGADFRSENVNVLSFSIDVNLLELLPSRVFDRKVERIVTRGIDVLQISNAPISTQALSVKRKQKVANLSHRSPIVETPRKILSISNND